MTIWIDADAFVEALNRSSIWGWSTEQDQTARNWALGIVEDVLNATEQPDGDTISRRAAIEAIEKNAYRHTYLDQMIDIINALPSAPDSRQRGEWVRLEREENVYDIHGVPTWGVNYMCDKCGFITTAIQDHFGQYKWCPSCGARMHKGGGEA